MREQIRNRLNVLSIMFLFFSAGIVGNAQAALFMARDHIVVDLRYGVDWLRCSVGQRWDGETCTGEVSPRGGMRLVSFLDGSCEQSA